jgi:hypothetical protein
MICLSLLAGTVGCGGGPAKESVTPVTGKVLHQGKPAVGAKIVLIPLSGRSDGLQARGEVGPDGTFQLTTYAPDDGAPVGEYAVAVRWYPKRPSHAQDEDGRPPLRGSLPDLLGNRYSDPRTSGLKVRIEPGVSELPVFNLN